MNISYIYQVFDAWTAFQQGDLWNMLELNARGVVTASISLLNVADRGEITKAQFDGFEGYVSGSLCLLFSFFLVLFLLEFGVSEFGVLGLDSFDFECVGAWSLRVWSLRVWNREFFAFREFGF